MTKFLLSGATGRVGTAIVRAARSVEDAGISIGITRQDMCEVININGETFPGIKWRRYGESCRDRLDYLDNESGVDAIIDFSNPAVFDEVLRIAVRAKKPLILGTSGISNRQLAALYDATKVIPVFRGEIFQFKVKKFAEEAVKKAKQGCIDDLYENFYYGAPIPSGVSKIIRSRIYGATGRTIEVYSSSTLGKKSLICDWHIGEIGCHTVGFDELAHDVLEIAKAMVGKPAKQGEFYDLDDIWNELPH